MHPFEHELEVDARLHLAGASFLVSRWPRLAEKFIDVAVQALSLRAQWQAVHAADTPDTSRAATPR
jgi:hypothetical protein